ncbi:MAG: hypothetical protein HOP07_10375 [Bacteriovoracaceae bacterium]|nr:hypothetical protein [Bacteriovoracaceae bacterium]
MTQKPRAVRFSGQEEAQIQKFLELNSFLDFSTLARIAIKQFVENPTLNLKSSGEVSSLPKKKKHPRKVITKNQTTEQNEMNIYNH